MYGRRNQRKRGFRRIAVMLLALVMLVGVCVPGLRASAEGEPDVTVTQGTSAGFTGVSGVLSIDSVQTEATGLTIARAEGGTITVTAAADASVGTYDVTVTYSVAAPVEEQSEVPEEVQEGEADPEQESTEPKQSVESKTITFTVKVEMSQENAINDLYNRLMSTTTFDEHAALVGSLTEADFALWGLFTEEQNEAVDDHIDALASTEGTDYGSKDIKVEIKAGSSHSCTDSQRGSIQNSTVHDKDGAEVAGITVSQSGYEYPKISVSKDVPAGTYVVQFDQESWSWDSWDYITTTYVYEVEVTAADADSGSTDVGTFTHIEIEVNATVNVVIDGETVTQKIQITTANTNKNDFTVTAAYQDGGAVNFSYTQLKSGNGSNNGATVELTGSYPTGTKDNPAIYTISLVKDITFTLSGGREVTLPITLKVVTHYWDSKNACPGLNNNKNSWQNGNYIKGSGIDVPISAEDIKIAITQGKLQIEKKVVDENGTTISDNGAFRFTLQHNDGDKKGLYANFTNNAYTGASSTATEITVTAGQSVTLTDLPVGYYRITEIQADGYIVTGGTDYTLDFQIENKTDSEVPIATFTNMKLQNNAGVSIKKIASGLTSYPNPTVTIFDYTNDSKGNSVWSGSLTANGETLYLPNSLPAGTYIVEETGQTVDGYNCATSLSGNATIDGMVFTVEAGNRYDLTVNNVYTEKPKTTSVTVSKTVTGNMGDWGKEFTFTVSLQNGSMNGVTYQKYERPNANADYAAVENGSGTITGDTATFYLKHNQKIVFVNVPIGATVIVTETDTDYDEYVCVNNGSESKSNTASVTVTNDDTVAFRNHNEATIDTGIVSDSMPFILLFAVAAVGGGVLLMSKRRYSGKF